MDLQNRNFPYPVLCDWTDDFNDESYFTVTVNPVLSHADGKCLISFDVALQNDVIRGFIQEGKAGIFCNIECSETALRKSFPLELNQITKVSFDTGLLSGKVEFCPAIIALETIEHYQNNFDPDFGGNVRIESGLMLAIGHQCSINVEISNNLLEFIPSAFVLSPLPEDATVQFEIDYSGAQIKLKIKKDLFKQYKSLNTSPQNKDILTASIYLPALMLLVSKIQTITEQETGDFSEYENCKWFLALNRRVKELFGREITEKELFNPPSRVMEIVNKILDYPVSKTFNVLIERGVE